MSNTSILEEIRDEITKNVSDIADEIVEMIGGKAEPLRDETTFHPVTLPRDLAAHKAVQTEWWYYTGHAETAEGREFGFELVFFKRRTDLDNFSFVPLRVFGNPLYFAHFAITDITNKTFRYEHIKSGNNAFQPYGAMSENRLNLVLGEWSIRESGKSHLLKAKIGDAVFEAILTPQKEVVMNGAGRDGVSYKDEGEASRYFSYTRMAVDGSLTEDGKNEKFSGLAWMDREFGTWTPTENQKGWDWFSIQLNNGCELMCYQLRNSEGGISPFSCGSYVDEHGNSIHLTNDEITITPTATWKSPHTGAEYPSGWKLSVPKVLLDLEVTPVMKDQELDTRGTTMIVYWEGACRVKGTAGGHGVEGKAYVELVGYDRSHDQPNLARFLIGDTLGPISRFIFD